MQPELRNSVGDTANDPIQNSLKNDATALRHSAYHGPGKHGVKRYLPTESDANGRIAWVHDMLKSMVLNQQYPCTGARSAFNRDDYQFGLYPPLATPAAARGLAYDLYEFTREFPRRPTQFYSFIAIFDGPVASTEVDFERLLWRQLQQLHDIDAPFFDWDPSVAQDPEDPQFCFSFGGKAYFVIGLHAAASRLARRFAWPAIVFNAHEMFERAREQGTFPKLQSTIRNRDQRLQGCINPMVQEFGTASEARQYSGRRVGDDWKCPFQPHETQRY